MGVFGSIDIAHWSFWICVAAAIMLQPLQITESARRWVLAAVNLGFLYWLLGTSIWIPLTLISVMWLVAWTFTSDNWMRRGGRIAAVVLLPILFYDYRIQSDFARLIPELAVIGFAYIILRMIDMLRSCWEQRQAVSILECINYLTPFHMLAAGPIQSWQDFRTVDRRSAITQEQTLQALERIATGMLKKFVIAYAIQSVFLTGFETSGLMYVVEVQMFYIWLYLDFSGYTDVAIGVGILIGAPTPENFDRPYLARNMVDFWERWHITLSLFLRRNLFIPLEVYLLRWSGGKAAVRISVFVFFCTFAVSALWHSVSLGFLIWGLAHAIGVSAVISYRYLLRKTLGTRRLKAYQNHPVIKVMAIVITFEYVAWTLIPIIKM